MASRQRWPFLAVKNLSLNTKILHFFICWSAKFRPLFSLFCPKTGKIVMFYKKLQKTCTIWKLRKFWFRIFTDHFGPSNCVKCVTSSWNFWTQFYQLFMLLWEILHVYEILCTEAHDCMNRITSEQNKNDQNWKKTIFCYFFEN